LIPKINFDDYSSFLAKKYPRGQYAKAQLNYAKKYLESQAFLGWTNMNNYKLPNGTYMNVGSPQYTWAINKDYNYANVAGSFWHYMDQGYTVINALHATCNDIYGVNFSSSYINGWLVVWGNKNLELP
jgi:hypothetical protein